MQKGKGREALVGGGQGQREVKENIVWGRGESIDLGSQEGTESFEETVPSRKKKEPEIKVRAEEEVVGPAHKHPCYLLAAPTCGRTRDGEPIHRA